MMRSHALRVVVRLLTFGLGLAVASVWLVSRVDPETPPCRSCAAIYASAANEIPTVTLCDIANDPERYRGRMVRLDVIFLYDSGTFAISDATAGCAKNNIFPGVFADSHASCEDTQKALSIYSGYKTGYDMSPVGVVVVGSLDFIVTRRIHGDGEGFNILCLEQVKPEGAGIVQRIYYTVNRIFSSVFKLIS
jgi:hypothetical protein